MALIACCDRPHACVCVMYVTGSFFAVTVISTQSLSRRITGIQTNNNVVLHPLLLKCPCSSSCPRGTDMGEEAREVVEREEAVMREGVRCIYYLLITMSSWPQTISRWL